MNHGLDPQIAPKQAMSRAAAPPQHTVVFCVDEKTAIQALNTHAGALLGGARR